MSEANGTVKFFPEQIKYLEKIFPQRVLDHTITENEIRHYNGQQSVLQFIRTRTK